MTIPGFDLSAARYLTDLELLSRLLESARLAGSAEAELFALGHADGVASAKQFAAAHNDLGRGVVVGVGQLGLVLFVPDSDAAQLVAPAEVSIGDLSEVAPC